MIYGWLASFHSKETFLQALGTLSAEKVPHTSYSSYEVKELLENHSRPTLIKFVALICALFGLFGGFFMQYYASKIDAPLNIGGRPLNSWVNFVPVTFVLTILSTGIGVFFTFLIRTGLPRPYHPVFNAPSFDLSLHQYYIVIQATTSNGKEILAHLNPLSVEEFSC